MMEISVYSVATRRIRKVFRVSDGDVANLQCRGGEAWVLGKHDPQTFYIGPDGDGRPVGDGGPGDPGPLPVAQEAPIVVAPAEVNGEVERRINDAGYDQITQINAMRGADDVDFAWIDAVRQAGRKLKAMTPIPSDYADDRNWPDNPDTTKGTPNG